MFYVYILENENKRHYIGCTNNLEKRLLEHNTGKNRWTKNKGIWKIIYKEIFHQKDDAFQREKQMKSYKGGRAFKALLEKVRKGVRVA